VKVRRKGRTEIKKDRPQAEWGQGTYFSYYGKKKNNRRGRARGGGRRCEHQFFGEGNEKPGTALYELEEESGMNRSDLKMKMTFICMESKGNLSRRSRDR